MKKAKEIQNQSQYDNFQKQGPVELGVWTSHIWRSDPKHLGFTLARYKFCAKMLAGKNKVIEIGCGDGLGAPVVLQTVKSVHGVDFEPLVISQNQVRFKKEGITRATFEVKDVLKSPIQGPFDAAYSLDVIEHIPQKKEKLFISNVVQALTKDSIFIVGTPNIEASKHASPASAIGHINLKSQKTLRDLMSQFFDNVFIFSMNDEVVHTGFSPMAHYLIAMAVGKKSK